MIQIILRWLGNLLRREEMEVEIVVNELFMVGKGKIKKEVGV